MRAGVSIRGEIRAAEDLLIDGDMEGSVHLPQHCLVVGPRARLKADVFARAVLISGEATGTFTASERVEIAAGATVHGRIVAPRLSLADGAFFTGRVEPARAEAALRVARYRLEHPGGAAS